jgi:hypothetical protein
VGLTIYDLESAEQSRSRRELPGVIAGAADLYLLDGGEVIEVGSHAELMARGGTYAELLGLQAAAYAG